LDYWIVGLLDRWIGGKRKKERDLSMTEWSNNPEIHESINPCGGKGFA
jgi:hypothetical protein